MKNFFCIFILAICLTSCSNDEQPIAEEIEETPPVETPPVENLAGKVELYKSNLIEDAYVLVNDAGNDRVYLMEKEKSQILFEWDLPSGIGNDAELLPNGNLLVALTVPDPEYTFGGYGGRIAIIDPAGKILWDYLYSDEVNLAHHDIEYLPNGNVLLLAWEKKADNELTHIGFTGEDEVVYSEKLLEIDPRTNEIIWEWNTWDHLIQDQDAAAGNFGTVEDHPERINVNYVDALKEGSYNGDIFHANALDYDVHNNLIYLSVNHFSEVWVIDHSTSTDEAKTGSGGNYHKGGDLVYRFGNPAAYNNPEGERMFFHNHNPNLVAGTNNLLVYVNGIPSVEAKSTVYELKLPEIFDLQKNFNNELEVVWSFAHEDLFAAKVSGANRLPNGNTLITEGTYGLWEVTSSGEVVWKFEGEDGSFLWRGYHFNKNDDAIKNLQL